MKPPPEGPVLDADVEHCLGEETICVSRRPVGRIGQASWTVFLAVFHPSLSPCHHKTATRANTQMQSRAMTEEKPPTLHHETRTTGNQHSVSSPWYCRLEKVPLIFYKEVACTTISRTTLIVFFLLSTSGENYRYDGPAGFAPWLRGLQRQFSS